MADITYCTSGCPFKDCERHESKIAEAARNGQKYVSIADFAPVCRRYIASLVKEVLKDG